MLEALLPFGKLFGVGHRTAAEFDNFDRHGMVSFVNIVSDDCDVQGDFPPALRKGGGKVLGGGKAP